MSFLNIFQKPDRVSEPEPDDFYADDEDQEREAHLAGIIARSAEQAGLIHKTDDFSFEWHSMFDAEIEAAQHAAEAQIAAQDAPAATVADADGASAQTSTDFSPEFGFGSSFGSDFGGDFGGNF